MANPEHLKILAQGIPKWNEWREEKFHLKPDLRGVLLRGANLRRSDLCKANLKDANLEDAILDDTDEENEDG